MLSILIPTYNYNINPLVSELYKQCLESNIEFEILCLDDFSTEFLFENSKIDSLDNCGYFRNVNNLGRTATRNVLANKAKYEWLLFLDADVVPVNKDFINQYIYFFNSEYKVIIGGNQYKDEMPENNCILRYKYGKKFEEKTAVVRNLSKYQYVLSGNMLIQKEIFLKANYKFEDNFYGMDVYFAYQLFINKTSIFHIDNPVYHLGLENNEVFFKKSLDAVGTRKNILLNSKNIDKISPILKLYKNIKKYHLTLFVATFFKISKPYLKKRILNKNPNLFCFNLYRLGFICSEN